MTQKVYRIINGSSTGSSGKVKVSDTDSTSNYLNDKLVVGSGLSKEIIPGSEQTLKINLDDENIPIGEAVQEELDSIRADLYFHEENFSNPHLVTKQQVGLGNVDNTSDLDKPVSNATLAILQDQPVIEVIALQAADIANKKVVLSSVRMNKERVLLVPQGGIPQVYGEDFIIITEGSNDVLSWDGLGLDNFLDDTDTLVVYRLGM
jgi:hypothetical protein